MQSNKLCRAIGAVIQAHVSDASNRANNSPLYAMSAISIAKADSPLPATRHYSHSFIVTKQVTQ